MVKDSTLDFYRMPGEVRAIMDPVMAGGRTVPASARFEAVKAMVDSVQS